MMRWLRRSRERFGAWWRGDLRVVKAQGDTLPEHFPRQRLVHMVDGDTSWSVGMHCPCGCGENIELLLLRVADPHWTLSIDWLERPTLQPSVWKKNGCRSHFFVRSGQIIWAEPRPAREELR